MFFCILLPILAFGTLTASLTEALSGAVAVVLVFALIQSQRVFRETLSSYGGMTWIPDIVPFLVLIVGAVAVLWMQYRYRKTSVAWGIFGLFGLAALAAPRPIFSTVFAIQQHISGNAEAVERVRIEFEKGFRRPGITTEDSRNLLEIPVAISGVRPDQILVHEAAGGRYNSLNYESALDYGNRRIVTTIPSDGVPSQAGALEIDLWLTLMRLTAQQTLPVPGTTSLRGIGVCGTSLIFDGRTELDVACSLGSAPSLMRWSLNGAELMPNQPREISWWQNYLPVVGHGLVEERTRFPLMARPGKATFVMKAYEPLAHFKRHLSIPVSELR